MGGSKISPISAQTLCQQGTSCACVPPRPELWEQIFVVVLMRLAGLPPAASSSLQQPPAASSSLQQPPAASSSLQQLPAASSRDPSPQLVVREATLHSHSLSPSGLICHTSMQRGERGERGERGKSGERGDRGERGAAWVAWGGVGAWKAWGAWGAWVPGFILVGS